MTTGMKKAVQRILASNPKSPLELAGALRKDPESANTSLAELAGELTLADLCEIWEMLPHN